MNEESLSCGNCGGKIVYIRGRYPGMDERKVCPTCMADTIAAINQRTSKGYGVAMQAIQIKGIDPSDE